MSKETGEQEFLDPSGGVDWSKIQVTAADIARFGFTVEGTHGERHPPTPLPLEISGDEDDSLVERLRSLKAQFGISDQARVVCPGSGTDVAIARAFGKNVTMCVDPDGQTVEALTAHGYLATQSRIEDFVPPHRYNVLAATNSYGVPTQEVLDRIMEPGGLIITNNYTHWAHDIAETTNAHLVGAILPSYSTEHAKFRPAEALPAGSTDIVTRYYNVQTMQWADGPGPGVFADDGAKFPDALFVFRMPENGEG